jgi:hypothetical protein
VIGVISQPGQKEVVEEFFELFKTPWEFYEPGRAYDVVIATTADVPEVDAKLLLVYNATASSVDNDLGMSGRAGQNSSFVQYGERRVPIYGDFMTFAAGIAQTVLILEGEPCGVRVDRGDQCTIRVGFDLFGEIRALLSDGQPARNAELPSLDIHIQMIRDWMVEVGISFVEITPSPHGYEFSVCLTHDIDFIGIRYHFFDHSMLGFVLRATVGSVRKFLSRKLTFSRLLQCWTAVASLPFVFAGWMKDFWEPFEWYLRVEKGLPATYFIIPFKRRAGSSVSAKNASRRATAYDITDLPECANRLLQHGCEIGVHGLDAWHSAEKGREERQRISGVTHTSTAGIRMHWLLQNGQTPAVLEAAGFRYDSSCGYNDNVGYRAGTGQVFRPFGATTLLEIPLHIQDGAMFYPQQLDLSEPEAEQRCKQIIDHAAHFGGVLTLLWHDRSHGPERFWGDFYERLVSDLRTRKVWFATAQRAVAWFACRRTVSFSSVSANDKSSRLAIAYDGQKVDPPLNVRVYGAISDDRQGELNRIDLSWNGERAGLEEFLKELNSKLPGRRGEASTTPQLARSAT